IGSGRRIEWTIKANAADVRIESETWKSAGLDRASQKLIVQIEIGSVMRRKERHADRMKSGFGFEPKIDRAGLAGAGYGCDAFIPIEKTKPFAIEQNFELFPPDFAEGLRTAHQSAVHRNDLYGIFAVGWKLVLDHDSAACSEWQAFDMVILSVIGGHPINGL